MHQKPNKTPVSVRRHSRKTRSKRKVDWRRVTIKLLPYMFPLLAALHKFEEIFRDWPK